MDVDDAATANLRPRMERYRSEIGGRSGGKARTQRTDAMENASDDGSDKNGRLEDMRVCYMYHDCATGMRYKVATYADMPLREPNVPLVELTHIRTSSGTANAVAPRFLR